MNENIDLTKILENCPKGWNFYSSVYGDVKFKRVQLMCTDSLVDPDKIYVGPTYKDDQRPIKFIAQGVECCVSSAGEHIKGKGECSFFPSKDCRDWSKFTAPWYKKEKFDPKTLQPFDKVLVRDEDNSTWKIDFFSNNRENAAFPFKCVSNIYKHCIPYNDDTKHLIGTADEAPEYYKYWED